MRASEAAEAERAGVNLMSYWHMRPDLYTWPCPPSDDPMAVERLHKIEDGCIHRVYARSGNKPYCPAYRHRLQYQMTVTAELRHPVR